MPRLLATQSHVVHGYVGNKAATFPLQCLGWDVDCCNSVQFSNHTGYGLDKVFGTITNETDLKELLSGLFDNFPQDYQALLSGYLPNKNSVRCMGRFCAKFKEKNPEIIWLMDPVMGDEGQLYVSEDVIPEYRKLALSPKQLVDIITPNQFELEILYGEEIKTKDHLKKALEILHNTIPVIIVTSCDSKMFDDQDYIYCVASMKNKTPIVYRVPFIDSYFTGVGDLFSALLLDRVYKILSNPITTLKFEDQVNNVLNVIQKVLNLTRSYTSGKINAKMGSALEMKEMELRIVESRDIYETINVNENDYIYTRL
ncbi:putative pyridoxal kinase BUD16 SKDI_05G0400 [Saccharomyces kudriavzevii IFO 1802]|uniref:Uncharacterized protein n=2 Tax=Saccharomyces kudriavzevii (strain ATCC MYA-4449 / AS 2.2408 / CBS 8840 / NBRC 1802 / NCYC 2889) TaxID=226230 RepID=A0AA35NRB5_SACK1|nr:uncharacterized protein SKDI_05G0400 [Saccharomyces kudriavzevii IFO 1802]EJT44838.1 BUD16-like protein [Saccharomyces kudriavzevii IFO 1802]CAI4059875.1 hypothetical protein SKDI_05G0400 [Saccharomyces kudriavzevii IFO 1802]